MITKSSEEYLKTIYLINKQIGDVRVTNIANKMNCTKPSVNKALHILKDNSLITYEPYGKIELTQEGEDYAKKIIAAYDIVYLFLSEILGMDKESAQEQAEQIKASMTDETLNSLAKYVYSELRLGDLNCHYDLNREKCRVCATLKKENASMKKRK